MLLPRCSTSSTMKSGGAAAFTGLIMPHVICYLVAASFALHRLLLLRTTHIALLFQHVFTNLRLSWQLLDRPTIPS